MLLIRVADVDFLRSEAPLKRFLSLATRSGFYVGEANRPQSCGNLISELLGESF